MDSYMARPRYVPKRPAAVQKHKRAPHAGGWLRRLIALQAFICIILLLMIVIIKSVHITATDYISGQVDYVLSHNVELKSIFSYVENLAADIRNSIAPGSAGKSVDKGLTASVDGKAGSVADGSGTASNDKSASDALNALDASDASADTSIEFANGTGETADHTDRTALNGASNSSSDGNSGIGSDETSDGTSNMVLDETSDGSSEMTPDGSGTNEKGDSSESASYEAGGGTDEAVSHPQTSVLAASSEEAEQDIPEMIAPAYGSIDTPFGRINGGNSDGNLHNGIDIGMKPGSSVVAAADGEVAETGISPDYGVFIRIDHKDGWQTVYAGCSGFVVQKGAKISKGDVVARIGNSSISVGYHLHFEVWKDGKPVNPLDYISVDAG